ncbi:MAG: hybrid sensor histidine kinase/response regulator [Verrucomicrobia bacterium]|nr:hybrid sensor histidine kinase/response regulator [Verrucomicrobiota bacterium]
MKKILIIDDSRDVREIVQDTLSLSGYKVLSAEDGKTGANLALEQLPDLILCDINMPKLDGFATLSLLRNDSATAVIPFIFLTGASDKGNFRRGMELGADDFLAKPFNAAELMAAVNTRLTKQDAVQQRTEKKLNELRGKITLALPHELRTPLNGIMGLSSILMEDYQKMPPAEIFESAKFINQAALRLHRLTENFLIYAQLELLYADPQRLAAFRATQTSEVSGLITEAVREKARALNRADDLNLLSQPVRLTIGQDHLRKIVEELTENALKFSAPGSPVIVHAGPSKAGFTCSFTDQGRGFTPEQIANIGAHMQFGRELYEQQGAGLGLFIAKRLCEVYGGALEIESTPKKRTTVRIVLPAAQGEPANAGGVTAQK